MLGFYSRLCVSVSLDGVKRPSMATIEPPRLRANTSSATFLEAVYGGSFVEWMNGFTFKIKMAASTHQATLLGVIAVVAGGGTFWMDGHMSVTEAVLSIAFGLAALALVRYETFVELYFLFSSIVTLTNPSLSFNRWLQYHGCGQT